MLLFKKKSWFDDDYSNIVERRKQAKLKFFHDPTQFNRNNFHNERRETSCTLLKQEERLFEGKTERNRNQQ